MVDKLDKKRLLSVGLGCLDIVNKCEYYPQEDEKLRGVSQHWQVGGNAANSAKVLAQIGTKCDFLGSLSSNIDSHFVINDLKRRGIGTKDCVFHSNCGLPTSCVMSSLATGSRTIVHARNGLPELTVEDFEKVQLHDYSWVHFEGRNHLEIVKMIDVINRFRNRMESESDRVVVSVEIEKKRKELLALVPLADVVFISKDFAQLCGHSNAESALQHLSADLKGGGVMLCAWGDQGASGIDTDGTVIHCKAFAPETVIDTLGAGDTFIAGVIHCLNAKKTLREALLFGCQLAGKKCGQEGFENLVT